MTLDKMLLDMENKNLDLDKQLAEYKAWKKEEQAKIDNAERSEIVKDEARKLVEELSVEIGKMQYEKIHTSEVIKLIKDRNDAFDTVTTGTIVCTQFMAFCEEDKSEFEAKKNTTLQINEVGFKSRLEKIELMKKVEELNKERTVDMINKVFDTAINEL